MLLRKQDSQDQLMSLRKQKRLNMIAKSANVTQETGQPISANVTQKTEETKQDSQQCHLEDRRE